jgi:hypothetical protein
MPVIVTGHQPPPFHPGVWIKNFLAGSLARAVGGVGLNLTADNDEVHAQVLRFPTRAPRGARRRHGGPGRLIKSDADHASGDAVRMAEVSLAAPAPGLAFEEQPASALRREAAAEILAALPPLPAEGFRRCWQDLLAAARRAAGLGEAFALARRRLEEELGLVNLELPVSLLADSAAFRLFVAEMLLRHEAFFAAYNEALAEYRRAYRERSAAQPVPDLARDGPRLELPLWVWRAGEKRRRLWGEQQGGAIRLFADREPISALDVDAVRARRGSGGASPLAALGAAGWKIRPRALSMTLFVRLALGETFIHGLGGALYEKVTDAWCERLFGVRPPEIVLASCTVHLPLAAYPATPADRQRARRAVRDWQFNPDRLLAPAVRERPDVRVLIQEKQQRIAEARRPRPAPGQARIGTAETGSDPFSERPEKASDPVVAGPFCADARRRAFERIHALNEALAAVDPAGPAAARAELQRIETRLRYNAVLRNREYAFCLYPAEDLARFCREAAHL